MRAALAAQANPNLIDAPIADRFKDVSTRINAVTVDLASSDNPKLYSQVDIDKALVQPRWGETSVEIPPLPRTGRGCKFDAAIIVLDKIAKNYSNIQNNVVRIRDKLEALKARYSTFEIDQTGDARMVQEGKDVVRKINKIDKRIDNGKVFSPAMTELVEASLIALDLEQKKQQGSLICIDALAMLGGDILAGNNFCSEQGSGRWLPKPSDT